MRLAKPHLDIGLFTNNIEEQRDFWGRQMGLRLDHELDMGAGWVQHRYDAHGSVIKVNHRTAPLPSTPPSGYTGLTIARSNQPANKNSRHPGGDKVRLVTPGAAGVVRIGITLSTPNPARLLAFYRSALEFETAGRSALRCGDSILKVVKGPGGCDMKDFAAPGFRYITVQVYDADAEMARIAGCGGRIVRDTVNFAGVARYGFVADPDGNWIEISARTSLTGIKVK